MKNHWKSFVILASSIALIGCSKPGVSGTVEMDGKPVAAGQIRFTPDGDDGRKSFIAPIHGGEFEVEQADVEGSYDVVVEVHFVDSQGASDFYEKAAQQGPPDQSTAGERPNSHVFKEELKKGKNVLEYQLTGDSP